MRALYDSEADAIQIDLEQVERVDHDEDVGDLCTVAIAGGRVVGVELLSSSDVHVRLARAFQRYPELDLEALEAAASAALAAPDRAVEVDVAAKVAA